MIDPNWLNTTKKQDPDFAGSIWEKMEYDNALCPVCGAHLRHGICLNACHLNPEGRRRFSGAFKKAVELESEEETDG